MIHQFDAKIDVSSWMAFTSDLLKSWANHFGKAYTKMLRVTARRGGPSGARGAVWPIDTGRSRDAFRYQVKHHGSDQVTLNIYNLARDYKGRFSSYPYDVEYSPVTRFDNPNYNRGAAWSVLKRFWDELTIDAADGLHADSQFLAGAGLAQDTMNLS